MIQYIGPYTKMNNLRIFLAAAWLVGTVLLSGCGHKPEVLKQGVIWGVRWVVPPNAAGTTTYGLYRTEKMDPRFGGVYGQDMQGTLYPTCLLVRYMDSHDSHTQVIPLEQIVWLEFGDGGIPSPKQ
jgi:hypothetical protein